MVLASNDNAAAIREEIVGHLTHVLDKPGVEVGTHSAGDKFEFIVTVPAEEHPKTVGALKSLSAG